LRASNTSPMRREVTDDDSWAATLAAVEYLVAEEFASLMTALDETGAEVDVEEVEDGAVGQQQIAAQAAAALAMAPTDVVIATALDRKATKRHIAVSAAMQRAVFAEAALVARKVGVDPASLVPFGLAVLCI
jgi:hypothetical protein